MHHRNGRLERWLFDPRACSDLQSVLYAPQLPTVVDLWLSISPIAFQPGPLGKLATELLHIIFRMMSETRDVVCFALTCKYILSISKPHLLRVLKQEHAPWSGCRLIFIGSGTKDKGIPSGLICSEDLKQMKTAFGHLPHTHTFWTWNNTVVNKEDTRYLFPYTSDYYCPVMGSTARSDRKAWSDLHQRRLAELSGTSPNSESGKTKRLDLRRCELLTSLNYHVRPNRTWNDTTVLCNLSKGEYVRHAELTLLIKQDRRGAICMSLGLGQALLALICWTDSDNLTLVCHEKYRRRLLRGPWAGDKICITTSLEMPPLPEGKNEWINITKEIDGLMRHLWKNNVKGDWGLESDEEE
ncbi:hypothetical protein DICSQDRAFT_169221 [Dichomitus squalens LYAD-421 SS1]|uniref:F-box domain-containing protein n=1 Tax=Dichomitus squalens (strain LYAD-421) TaxID=732165 RepID=R7T1A6_DICSQ|nr:uncharacterized protein DICSQDRAFT_169221 [Dichomitus squalens LYAD-421 SS1]EJF62189.1 hypothetical protein DICSQDRAFT_169221 [Dichomitus squalens LYAD-421 SS1]